MGHRHCSLAWVFKGRRNPEYRTRLVEGGTARELVPHVRPVRFCFQWTIFTPYMFRFYSDYLYHSLLFSFISRHLSSSPNIR